MHRESGRFLEGMTQLVNATVFGLAIATLVPERIKGLEETNERPKVVASAPVAQTKERPQSTVDRPKVDPALIERLRGLPKLLGSRDELLRRAPKLAPALSPEESARTKCEVVRGILSKHTDDILTVAVFLNGIADTISHDELRASFQRQIRETLRKTPEEAVRDPEGVRRALDAHMRRTYTYGVIQRCSAVEMFFFGGFLSRSVAQNERKASPLVHEILEGVRTNKPGAVAAAEALGRMVQAFVSEP